MAKSLTVGRSTSYAPQTVTVELIRKLSKSQPPERPKEVRDHANGLILRHQPSGYLSIYAELGRGKRERICDARFVIDPNTTLTLPKVRNQARKLRGESAAGRDFKLERATARLVPALADYLDDMYGPWVIENRRTGQATVARIKACFEDEFANDKLDTITPARVEKWRSKRRRRGVSRETINRDVNALRGALTRAVKFKILKEHPLDGLEPLQVDRHKRVVRGLTEDEKSALLAALEARDERKREKRASGNRWRSERGYTPLPAIGRYADVLTPAVIVSLETGLRRGELLSLEWPRVDIHGETVHVEGSTTKSYETRQLPLTDDARRVLRDWWLQCGQPKTGYVFKIATDNTEAEQPIGNLKKSYYEVLKSAGIERIDGAGKRVNWHSLRHTFGSSLGARGGDPATVKELMGHADLETTQRYLHTDTDRKRAAIKLLAKASK